jgi:hypothetical protein
MRYNFLQIRKFLRIDFVTSIANTYIYYNTNYNTNYNSKGLV